MQIVRRGTMTYYLKDESVIVGINGLQHIGYNVYALQNRRPFYDFKKTIIASKEDQMTKPTDLIRIAKMYKLVGVSAQKPKVEE